MLAGLMLKGLRRGKARFACAVAGCAISVGVVVFTTSLIATNNAQAPALARRACAPWSAWSVEGIQLRGRRGMPPPQVDGRRRDRVSASTGETPVDSGAKRRNRDASPSKNVPTGGVSPRRSLALRGPRADLEFELLQLAIDYRPGGRVLQGPPMMAVMAPASAENPYGCTSLAEGRWVDDGVKEFEVVCTRNTMRRFNRGEVPPVGAEVKFLGRKGTMTAKIVGYLAEAKLPMGWPGVFANRSAFAAFSAEEHGRIRFWRTVPETFLETSPRSEANVPGKILTAASEEVVTGFKGDEQRRMDYATPLMLVAAVLTALSLLVNSLLLSVESNRTTLAQLRMVGLTRGGVVGFVALEALCAGVVGWLLGVGVSAGALIAYVSSDATAFPVGVAFDVPQMGVTFVLLLVVAALAVLFALRPALAVRAMDASVQRPRPRRRGMAVTFTCGFAAFVAVEVWGASLMRGFVPSVEWPDAIVSILPGGVSSFDVEKLRKLEGVKRISELVPRQVALTKAEDRNALFLGAEWLPEFKFLEGTWEEAQQAVFSSDAVVITEMMSRAHGLHKGDRLSVQIRGGRGPAQPVEFPIAGVVDLNWHMVTSRGLVRGMNGMPGMTDGPVFASLDTLGIVDPRTYITDPNMSAPMTHLWVEYEPAFLARHGVFPAGRKIESAIAKALGLDASRPPALLPSHPSSTVRLHARDEIADGTLAHGSDVIGQAARVPFVFLFVLAIGFVAMLVAEADAKRREFAILRAVGATKGQLTARLAGSAVKTALVGIVCGVPTGALVGWLFAFKTNIWPGMPHYFVLPVQVVAEGALGAVVFALVFAVPTAVALIGRAVRSGSYR